MARCPLLPPLPLSAEEICRRRTGEPYVIRQKIPESGVAGFGDIVYGHIEVDVRGWTTRF